jgi:hypothetical protein
MPGNQTATGTQYNCDTAPRPEVANHKAFLNAPVSLSYGWLFFALFLCLQFALFFQSATRQLAFIYPTGWDQTAYLSESFEIYDQMQTDGIGRGLLRAVTAPIPQGKLLQIEAAVLFLFTRPSRISAWGLNFLYLALLEYFVVSTLLWLDGGWHIALMGLGLLLATATRFGSAGGVLDFRLDFIASCLFGIFICLLVRSAAFALFGWSLAAGVAAGLLVASRFLTAMWLFPLMAVLFLTLFIRLRRSHGAPEVRAITLQRLKGLAVCAFLAGGISVPIIWVSRAALIQYYVITQAGSTESGIRRAEFGVNTATDFILYYLKNVPAAHLGATYILLCIVLALLGLLTGRLLFDRLFAAPLHTAQTLGSFLPLTLFIPFIVLTAWPVKSPVVGNVLVIPSIANTFLLFACLPRWFPKLYAFFNWREWKVMAALPCLLALLAGCSSELRGQVRPSLRPEELADYRELAKFYEEIGNHSLEARLYQPKVMVDRLYDFLAPLNLEVIYYENHMVLLRPTSTVGPVSAVPAQVATDALRNSDLIVLTQPHPPAVSFRYPFDQSMESYYPQLLKAAEKDFVPDRSFYFFGQDVTLYFRPTLRMTGDSGGWITSAGIKLYQTASVLRERPIVELSGETMLFEHLTPLVPMVAEVSGAQGVIQEIRTSVKAERSYRITIALDKAHLPSSGDVQIHLQFGKYFIPKEVGYNEDTRQLVFMAPQRIRLLRSPSLTTEPVTPSQKR